jgi:methyltransferase-like protein/2-polyprenyl-3-methyl-5-hydroxy-6-metoxy-1,4-benzoquinol methylase
MPNAPTAYDKVLYPSYTRLQTHPDRLATIGKLLGMSPAPVEHCRVLELGCGNGSNLGPIAFGLPQSEFVGVDLAATPIANAQRMVAEIGLTNLTFQNRNITEVTADLGKFDYIICHGVYSWVPEPVREAILRICREKLNPNGVAFVSYNAYPGNRLREMIREMMLFHVQGFSDPAEQVEQARALASFVAAAQDEHDLYRRFLKSEMEMFLRQDANYVFHDALAEINTPFYFHQFMASAQAHGLKYLGEADFHIMLDSSFPPEVGQKLDELSGNRIAREQYLDFLRCRRFRQTLLCHENIRLDLSLDSAGMSAFHIAGSVLFEPGDAGLHTRTPEKYEARNGARLQTDAPLVKAAIRILTHDWPQAIAFPELLRRAQEKLTAAGWQPADEPREIAELRTILFRAYAIGLVDLHTYSPKANRNVSEKPVASRLARWQIQDAQFVTSFFHNAIPIEDSLARELLLLLDGSRDRSALLAELVARIDQRRSAEGVAGTPLAEDPKNRELLGQALDQNLQRLAKMGLLAA